ncbi:MAG TPA: toll/interleukin-1 receptor domain-containing protein [Allosphingosinicella sp.]|jgi:hypothetical protein|nr:toll/interleukin-1 receptor domain-containing protein [Allosphingosinicella sp.]
MPYRLFISYASKDRAYRDRFVTHLAHPVREGRLAVWSDRMIPPGGEWDGIIRDEIRSCDAVVFLVSSDLVASEYVNDVEMEIARERRARGEIDVLAVPILHSLIDQTWLGALQALWDPESPIGLLASPARRDQAWVEVVRRLIATAEAAAEARRPAAADPLVPVRSAERVPAPIRFRRSVHAPLLARGGFFGREKELADLDVWLSGRPPHDQARVVVLRALGGMGKSALAWHWSQGHAAEIGPKAGFEGVFWWSFYAPGFHIWAFAHAALIFMGIAEKDMPKQLGSRLDLLAELTQDRAVIFILDGFERELRRYARGDAPDDAAKAAALSGAMRPDACVNQETDAFLGRIAATRGFSRWLMTTRVTPEILLDLDGVREVELAGLTCEATRTLFAEQGVSGTNAEFAELGARFGGHGLTLSVYARTLKRHGVTDLVQPQRQASDDALLRHSAPPGRDASALEAAADRRLRVLTEAVEALSEPGRDVLQSFTLVEKPPSVATLALLNSHLPTPAIPRALDELRRCGLLAPSHDAFVYELHPVVREVASRNIAGAGIERAIDAFRKLGAGRHYATIEEAQPAIDHFLVLIRSRRFDAAFQVYRLRLQDLFINEGMAGRKIELLSQLCGPDFVPLSTDESMQTSVVRQLASALNQAGRYGDAWRAARQLESLVPQTNDPTIRAAALTRIVNGATHAGHLADAVRAAHSRVADRADKWWLFLLDAERATLEAVLGRGTEARDLGRQLLARAGEIWRPDFRSDGTYRVCLMAGILRDAALHAEAALAYRAAAKEADRKIDLTLIELERLRALQLRPEPLTARECAEIASAAREVQTRIVAMGLFAWVADATTVAAVAEARAGGAPALRAARDLRELAEGIERDGGVIMAAQARIEAAEAWTLAGVVEEARADALHARKLAYCDGPPHSAKLFEDRADALLAKL